jgi:L-iditol 2-dehydrogenase
MKVLTFIAPGDVAVADVPAPSPDSGDLLIRVHNCSACGIDVKIATFGHHHIVPPRVLGHEIAREVVEVGARLSGWRPGDRVQVIAAVPCGRCHDCVRGWATVCADVVIVAAASGSAQERDGTGR